MNVSFKLNLPINYQYLFLHLGLIKKDALEYLSKCRDLDLKGGDEKRALAFARAAAAIKCLPFEVKNSSQVKQDLP